MSVKETIEKSNEDFEANFLDGDKMNDCGKATFTIDQDFIDWLNSRDKALLEAYKEELRENHFCCKYQTSKEEDFCDDCIRFIKKELLS